MAQAADTHGDIRHRREFDEYIAGGREQLGQQRQHIRPAVFQQENLPAVFRPPRRVEKEDVRGETAEDFGDTARKQLPAAEADVFHAQIGEIAFRRFSERGLHLVIKHIAEHAGESPAVHAEAAGQVRDALLARILHNPRGDGGLVAGRLRRAALLSGKAVRIDEGRHGVPLRNLGPEPAPAFERRSSEFNVDVRIAVAREQQAHRIVAVMGPYERRKCHFMGKSNKNPAKIIIFVFC